MAYKRKKISPNTYMTVNSKTGATRYTHTYKSGSQTISTSHSSNSPKIRRTTTTNVGGWITRKSTTSNNYKPPKNRTRLSFPKNTKVKYRRGRKSSGSSGSAFWLLVLILILIML